MSEFTLPITHALGNAQTGELNGHLVDLRDVVKTYRGSAGTFTALKGIN